MYVLSGGRLSMVILRANNIVKGRWLFIVDGIITLPLAVAGFVFFPTDLGFFIDFEIKDQDRRRNDGQLGRRVPTAEEYKTHQLSDCIIPTDVQGVSIDASS